MSVTLNPILKAPFGMQNSLSTSTMGKKPVVVIPASSMPTQKVVSKQQSLSTAAKVAIAVGVSAAIYGTAYGVVSYSQGKDLNSEIVSFSKSLGTEISNSATDVVNYVGNFFTTTPNADEVGQSFGPNNKEFGPEKMTWADTRNLIGGYFTDRGLNPFAKK